MWLTSRLGNLRRLTDQIGFARGGEAMLISAADRVARAFGARCTRPAVRLAVRGYDHPLYLRPGTSDLSAFLQIFTYRQYACLSYLENPKFIIDCGANVGYASAYLLQLFPGTKVIAVEPDPQNAETCRMNLAPYGDRAEVIAAAVWDKPVKLALRHNPSEREWSTQVVEAGSSGRGEGNSPGDPRVGHDLPDPDVTVRGIDMPALIARAGCRRVDLLKIDIEGAETQLFQNGAARWLPDIANIAIELHDTRSRKIFFAALANFQYDLASFGELTICRNLRAR